jgi:hypothetical protein
MHYETRCSDRIKLIFWDGTGLCLFAERMEDGIFRWPKIEDGDADLVVLDPGCFHSVHNADQLSKAKYTLFDGMNVPFLIEAVMLRGNTVYSDSLVHETPVGVVL